MAASGMAMKAVRPLFCAAGKRGLWHAKPREVSHLSLNSVETSLVLREPSQLQTSSYYRTEGSTLEGEAIGQQSHSGSNPSMIVPASKGAGDSAETFQNVKSNEVQEEGKVSGGRRKARKSSSSQKPGRGRKIDSDSGVISSIDTGNGSGFPEGQREQTYQLVARSGTDAAVLELRSEELSFSSSAAVVRDASSMAAGTCSDLTGCDATLEGLLSVASRTSEGGAQLSINQEFQGSRMAFKRLEDVEPYAVELCKELQVAAGIAEDVHFTFVGPTQRPPPRAACHSCVYVMELPKGFFYVGQSDSIGHRIKRHRSQRKLPLRFAFMMVPDRSHAELMEAALILRLLAHKVPLVNKGDQRRKRFGPASFQNVSCP